MSAVEQPELMTKLTGLGDRAAAGTGIEIVEIQLRGAGKSRLLRVYIDKPGGVTHGDCELISERLGNLLDQEDAGPGVPRPDRREDVLEEVEPAGLRGVPAGDQRRRHQVERRGDQPQSVGGGLRTRTELGEDPEGTIEVP